MEIYEQVRINSILYPIVMIFFMTSCISDKPGQGSVAFIDVKKKYPEKEILLTDIADVTYLHLNTDEDDYLYRGTIKCVTENTIVVVDNISESILFFSKDGNPKSRINRRGQGPEEYRSASFGVIYDEATDEVFVFEANNNIQVYSSTGIHKRKITLPQGTYILQPIFFDNYSFFFYDYFVDLNRQMVLLGGENLPATDNNILPYYRISRTDGEVVDYVELPGIDLFLGVNYNERWRSVPRWYLTKCPDGVLLMSPETDTIFLYSSDKSLTPVLYQIPSVVSLNPKECITLCLDKGRYQFLQSVVIREGIIRGEVYTYDLFPAKYYMRDKKTGEVVHPKLILPDYSGKEFFVGSLDFKGGDYENGYYFELDLYELKQAYHENRLSGRLKELVATLNEDEDNNVFVLVDFK